MHRCFSPSWYSSLQLATPISPPLRQLHFRPEGEGTCAFQREKISYSCFKRSIFVSERVWGRGPRRQRVGKFSLCAPRAQDGLVDVCSLSGWRIPRDIPGLWAKNGVKKTGWGGRPMSLILTSYCVTALLGIQVAMEPLWGWGTPQLILSLHEALPG